MGWWTSAPTDILNAIGEQGSARQVEFVTDWHANTSSDCTNNPLDISRPATGAHACQRLTPTRTARTYPTPLAAVRAFKAQVEGGQFPHILAAMRQTNPYAYNHKGALVTELKAWGSPKFAKFLSTPVSTGPGPPPGPPPTIGGLPKGHSGYHDLQRSLARTLPTNLRKARIIRGRVLRKLK